jgi:hypothetical protein
MSRKNNGREKGKGMATSGIPLSGGISQIENTSVESNRFEAKNAFKEGEETIDTRDYAHRDYISDEEDRIGTVSDAYIANKDDEEWSDGLEDEANLPDDFSDEALYPEIQPLHVDLGATAGLGKDDDMNMVLRPDTMDNQSDDFTDVEVIPDLKGKAKAKKSA